VGAIGFDSHVEGPIPFVEIAAGRRLGSIRWQMHVASRCAGASATAPASRRVHLTPLVCRSEQVLATASEQLDPPQRKPSPFFSHGYLRIVLICEYDRPQGSAIAAVPCFIVGRPTGFHSSGRFCQPAVLHVARHFFHVEALPPSLRRAPPQPFPWTLPGLCSGSRHLPLRHGDTLPLLIHRAADVLAGPLLLPPSGYTR